MLAARVPVMAQAAPPPATGALGKPVASLAMRPR